VTSVNERKIISLLQSEEFLAKLNDAENVDDAKKLFQSEGLDLSTEKVKIIMEALESATKKAHNGEIMTEKDLESVSGAGLITKALEFVVLSALICEGAYIGVEVYKRGGIKNPNVLKYINKGKETAEKAKNSVVEWLTGSPPKS
jgi:hypothetical protein